MKLQHILGLICLSLLMGCSQELYSELNQTDANEIVLLLEKEGIAVTKEPMNEGLHSLHVDADKMGLALRLLKQHGLPKRKNATIPEIFPEGDMIQSKVTENARYTYAIQEELANTLMELKGVTIARVHIVMPEKDKVGRIINAGKASVFIKHLPNVSYTTQIPKLKKFILNSVRGVAEENITITLFNDGNLSKK